MERIKCNFNIDDYTEEWGYLSQNHSQHDNLYLKLYRVTEPIEDNTEVHPGDFILEEYQGNDVLHYLITEEEYKKTDSSYQFLNGIARTWAENAETKYERILELLRWGLEEPVEFLPDEDYEGECCIICERHFYGYTPFSMVTKDEDSKSPKIFPSEIIAYEWINMKNREAYCLQHNEYGRPKYYVTPV